MQYHTSVNAYLGFFNLIQKIDLEVSVYLPALALMSTKRLGNAWKLYLITAKALWFSRTDASRGILSPEVAGAIACRCHVCLLTI